MRNVVAERGEREEGGRSSELAASAETSNDSIQRYGMAEKISDGLARARDEKKRSRIKYRRNGGRKGK